MKFRTGETRTSDGFSAAAVRAPGSFGAVGGSGEPGGSVELTDDDIPF